MAETKAPIPLTETAFTVIATGPIAIGTVTPEGIEIRVAISTTGAPSNLSQGHPVNPQNPWGFVLDTGEILYAISTNGGCTAVATY